MYLKYEIMKKSLQASFVSFLLFLFFCQSGLSQNISVNGIVKSAEDGLEIIGATILIEGEDESLGTVTDYDGSYSIDVPSASSVLVFSYVGMKTQVVPVNGQEKIDVILETETSTFKEVVIVGYGTQVRSKISGAVSTIDSEEITETPILRTEQALQGRSAGVTVTQNSGSPGSGLTVRIRGAGSINGGDPLYIVDGMPTNNLDFLNPNDIESISILKDAASAAIFGSRGANGIVLVTTKKGEKNQKGRINYESYYGVQAPWKKIHLLNAREYAIIQSEAHIAAGKTPPAEFKNPDALGEGTDWQDAIFQTAPIMNHQLGISGGGAKSTYAVSGNYFLQEGIVGGEKSRFERITARLNTNNEVNDWLSIGNTLGVTHFKRNALPENNEFNTPLLRALNMDPITPVRKFDGTYAYSLYADTDIANPVNQIEQSFNNWTSNRFLGSIFADVKIIDGLSFKTSYNMDITFAQQDIFLPIYNLSVDTLLGDAPATEISNQNTVIYNNYRWTNWQWENFLTYTRSFKEKHDFTGVLGHSVLKSEEHVSGGANSNLPSNDPDDAYIGNTVDPISSQSALEYASEFSLLSVFGRVNYDYDGKYLFSSSLRMDASSKFGPNNRYGIFPSFSAGWVVTQEDFWNVESISLLKLRTSWGKNGIDNTAPYAYLSTVNSGQNYSFGSGEVITNGSVPTVAANPDLKWEDISQFDIGLDVEFWEGKIEFATDYFIKNTNDMLAIVPVPDFLGAGAPVQNVASMQNRGWEFTAVYRDKKNEFKYGISGNITFVKNEVTNLGLGGDPKFSAFIQSANSFAARTDVGRPIASFYGYVTDGLFQNQAEVEAHAFQSDDTAPGDIRFKDLNGDGVINEEDRDYIGNPTPDYTYGMNLDMEYKGFDLSVFLQGVGGNDIYNGTVRYDFSFVNRPVSVLDRWTGEGTSDSEPRVNLNDPNQNARISDRFVEDGSYLRIKNVQIGYNVPREWLQKAKIQKIRIYASAQNLFTFTKYSGLDPEIGTIAGTLELGIDRGFYPQARAFLGGIQVAF